jgi:hypothetical protein
MQPDDKVSVIVPGYNKYKYELSAIKSCKEEYEKKQQMIGSRINEIFSGKQLLVAEYDNSKIIITKDMIGDLLTFNYEPYINSGGKDKVIQYYFMEQSFLRAIDKGKLKLLDETI